MRLAWLTDIHLDHLDHEAIGDLAVNVIEEQPDAVLVTGDISIARYLEVHLGALANAWSVPTYFVLGNHDFYGSSIAALRERCAEITKTSEWLRWLPACGVVSLTDKTALVGHDAWADARAGDPDDPKIRMRDWRVIKDFVDLDDEERKARLREEGDLAAAYLADVLPRAMATHDEVVVATHPPAFVEACRYKGRISPPFFLPHLVCMAAGEAIRAAAAAHPDTPTLCLAGHTHGHARETLAPNLRAWTGEATYGSPAVQLVLDLP